MKRRGGSFLIESMVALSIAIIGLLGMLTLLTKSLGLSVTAGQRAVAAYLAAEGIEVTKNIIDRPLARDGAWVSSLPAAFEVDYRSNTLTAVPVEAGSQSALRRDTTTGFYSYAPNGTVETPYRRTMRADLRGDEVRLNAIVKWTGRGGTEEVNIEDHFWFWRKRPGP